MSVDWIRSYSLCSCLIVLPLLMLLAGVAPAAAQKSSPDGVWTPIESQELELRKSAGSRPGVRPEKFRAFEIDAIALDLLLDRAPGELDTPTKETAPVLTLPRPDGTFERFRVVESSVVDSELEAWMADQGFPMKTYSGDSLDRPATTVRFDWNGPDGFHAMVLSADGGYLIDPYWLGDRTLYVSYARQDVQGGGGHFSCEAPGSQPTAVALEKAVKSTSGNLRTYRLAAAATGEYTQFFGGTQAQGQAQVVTTINRVNQIYERDLSVRLVLVADNQDLIFTNAATDPYTNGDCSTMFGENQTEIDTTIGSDDYDIGHVFDRLASGSSGRGDIASVCDASRKAQGCTGATDPTGDPFHVDFVAHEIGHQFGGFHTWNGTAGSCTAGGWSSTSAYEPGSGSTIMAYAGICGADNLQGNSDPFFHRRSLDQILAFVNGAGNCFATISNVNPWEPSVDAGPNFTIPQGTPFELTARNGNDNDGDSLTYSWEQYDLGTRAALSTGDDGTQPIFRSHPPLSSPTRVFPRLQELLQNSTPTGETLPTQNRTMTFRVTVRDNRSAGGRERDDSMTVTATTTSGPFALTSPNGGETLQGSHTVTWNVANTTASPVNAAQVDILLSVDGGQSFPFVLARGTANDGSETVTLPAIKTTQARVKVRGSGNIFFDLSNDDFTLDTAVESPVMLVLLDRTGSMTVTRSATGNSRCSDALTLAQQDVQEFAAANPGGFMAVWTFASSAPSDLTGGFADEAAALAALNGLSAEGCSGLTPLAESMCAAADELDKVQVGAGDRILAVSSDGGENNSSGVCAGPDSVSDTAPYDPGSWQNKVHQKLVGTSVVMSRFWGSVSRGSVDPETGKRWSTKASDADFFQQLAAVTEGIYQGVGDSEPLPPPVFQVVFSNTSFERNSGFGTSVLDSWEVVNLPGSSSGLPGLGNWYAQSGPLSPESGIDVAVPIDGQFAAMSDQTGPGSHVLYQDFVVPSGVWLSCEVFINNVHGSFLNAGNLDFEGGPNQHARIDIMDPAAPLDDVGGGVLQNLFLTRSGDPTISGYSRIAFDLSAFAGDTVRLRFAEVDNQFFFMMGVDNCKLGNELFADGFESGDIARWSGSAGPSRMPAPVPPGGDSPRLPYGGQGSP